VQNTLGICAEQAALSKVPKVNCSNTRSKFWTKSKVRCHPTCETQAKELKSLQIPLGIVQSELRKVQEQSQTALVMHGYLAAVSWSKVGSSVVSTALLQATELKRLQNALGIAQSELRKVQEQYAECNKYCAFLDSITPHEFFQGQAARYEAEWQVRV